jgi:hypothetical protein
MVEDLEGALKNSPTQLKTRWGGDFGYEGAEDCVCSAEAAILVSFVRELEEVILSRLVNAVIAFKWWVSWKEKGWLTLDALLCRGGSGMVANPTPTELMRRGWRSFLSGLIGSGRS